MRILHLADVHLDRPFVGLAPELADARRRHLRGSVERSLELAAERGAELVTIGGDLWEDEHVTADTRAWLAGALARCGRPVVLIAGNHDPLRPGGPYGRTSWPQNVHLFPAGALTEFRAGNLSVWGVSWGAEPLPLSGLLAGFRVPADGRRHVLLVHGTADGHGFAADEGAAGFFTGRAVRDAGFALCLAGHIHRASVRDGVVYPGSPEPLGRSETGRHCVALVDGDDVELLDVNTWRYEDRTTSCEGAASGADVERSVVAALSDADPENVFLRLTLRGTVERGCDVDVAGLEAAHGGRYARLELRDATRPAFDLHALAAQPTAVGRFVARLQERIAEAAGDPEATATLELALELGVRAMHEDEVLAHVD